MTFTFESMPGADLVAEDFGMKVVDIGRNAPQNVIKNTQPWRIEVEWHEEGLMAGVLPGNWVVDAYVESIGQGGEFKVGTAATPMAFAAHNVVINVPASNAAGGVPLAPGEQTTPYKLVVTLTADNGAGGRYPMAGYAEGPILQFYQTP